MPRYAALAFLWLLFFLAGCAATAPTGGDVVTVEGMVTVRGNEPFTALVLETDARNSYVLRLGAEERTALQNRTPVRIRATGRLEVADWNGRPWAHLTILDFGF